MKKLFYLLLGITLFVGFQTFVMAEDEGNNGNSSVTNEDDATTEEQNETEDDITNEEEDDAEENSTAVNVRTLFIEDFLAKKRDFK